MNKNKRKPKTHNSAFVKRVQNFAHQENLWRAGERILIGVSGGPDSMALLHFFLLLQKKYHLELLVAHVNYQLRGDDSEKDFQLVQKTAKENDIPFFYKKVSPKNTSEEFLRDIRRAFFEKTAKENSCTKIALAHTEDDQVETFFLRLIRGSGKRGLASIRPMSGLYIRPFLTTPKKDIFALLKAASIPYRIDKTNTQAIFLRNKVRLELLPLLESYNPKIRKSIITTVLELQKEILFEETLFRKYFSVILKGSTLSFSYQKFLTLTPEQHSFFLHKLFALAMVYPPEKTLCQNLILWLSGGKKSSTTLTFSRLRASQKNGRIHIHFGN